MKNLKEDVNGFFEPIFILIGIAIIALVTVALWLMDLVWFAVAGLLFFVGALILLQGTPIRGWFGIIIGAIILVISLLIGVFVM